MKKLFLALAVVAVATMANAASVKWSLASATSTTTGATAPTGGSLVQGWVAYLYTADTISDTLIASIKDGTFDGSGATASATVNAMGAISKTISGFEASTAYTLSMVLFDAATVADAENFIVGNGLDITTTGSTLAAAASFTNIVATSEWQAIPEPTSGMLLLVGGALLALKRKRA